MSFASDVVLVFHATLTLNTEFNNLGLQDLLSDNLLNDVYREWMLLTQKVQLIMKLFYSLKVRGVNWSNFAIQV